jgi:NDP-sugar pyrophosphorylase family protein
MRTGGIIAAGWGERLGQKIPKALTPVGGRKLIDYTLDGLEAAGLSQITCIVNEAATEVPAYVRASRPHLQMEWIIRTTPSSMHSFLIVLERLAKNGPGPFFMTTVDSVCSPETYRRFAEAGRSFQKADVLLGLTDVIEDEKPLRVTLRDEEQPGIYQIAEIGGASDSAYVTSGFYWVQPTILKEKNPALEQGYSALRQYLGHLLKYGYRFYGIPLPPVIDVDRPEDIRSAERFLTR